MTLAPNAFGGGPFCGQKGRKSSRQETKTFISAPFLRTSLSLSRCSPRGQGEALVDKVRCVADASVVREEGALFPRDTPSAWPLPSCSLSLPHFSFFLFGTAVVLLLSPSPLPPSLGEEKGCFRLFSDLTSALSGSNPTRRKTPESSLWHG